MSSLYLKCRLLYLKYSLLYPKFCSLYPPHSWPTPCLGYNKLSPLLADVFRPENFISYIYPKFTIMSFAVSRGYCTWLSSETQGSTSYRCQVDRRWDSGLVRPHRLIGMPGLCRKKKKSHRIQQGDNIAGKNLYTFPWGFKIHAPFMWKCVSGNIWLVKDRNLPTYLLTEKISPYT